MENTDLSILFQSTPYYRITYHPSYITVKPYNNLLQSSFSSSSSTKQPEKLPVLKRNSRIREIGYSYDNWKTFITLTLAPAAPGVYQTVPPEPSRTNEFLTFRNDCNSSRSLETPKEFPGLPQSTQAIAHKQLHSVPGVSITGQQTIPMFADFSSSEQTIANKQLCSSPDKNSIRSPSVETIPPQVLCTTHGNGPDILPSDDPINTDIGTTFTEANYKFVQDKFRRLVKYLKKQRPDFVYLAVLEHGGQNGRIHFHMLTNLDFDDKYFEKSPLTKKRKRMPLWKYGFSDVVQMKNSRGAVGYILKYISKEGYRTPVGKREVFHTEGLGKVEKKIGTYKDVQELLKLNDIFDIHHDIWVLTNKKIVL